MSSAYAIDIWTNLFTEEALRQFIDSPVQRVPNIFGQPELFEDAAESPETFTERMVSVGVGQAIIPAATYGDPATNSSAVNISTEAVHEICQEYPDRFHGLFGVNPDAGMGGVERLETAIEDYGFVGAILVPYGFERPPNHRTYYPFYAKCVELDVPVQIQAGHTMARSPKRYGKPLHLDDVALEFPDLEIVAANIGWPWTEELISLAWTHSNVNIGTTAHAPQYWEDELIEFIRGHGKDKVLWGTSHPIIDQGESIAQVEDLNLPDDIQQKLLYENAARVFDL